MKFYKVINLLDQVPNAWDLLEIDNFDEFELKKINTGEAINIEKNLKLKADLESGRKEMDFHLNVSGLLIVSDKFKSLIRGDEAEFYPVKITNIVTKMDYYVLRILNFYDCVAEKHSEYSLWSKENTDRVDRHGNYKSLNRFVIDNSKVGNARIFRLKKYFPTIIVNNELKLILEGNKISGIGFSNTN